MAFGNIGGAEPSTITFKVATVTHARGSTTEHQEILVVGGQESSLAIAAVLNAAPASSAWALAVREVAPSTVVSVSTGSMRVHQSSAADLNVTVAGYVAPSTTVTVSTAGARVFQSTAADLNVTVAGYVAPSTVVSVSTGSVRVHQSTAADLNVTVAGYSTVVSVSTGSVRVHQSTAGDLNVTVANLSTTVAVSSVAGAVQARTFTSSGGSVEGSTTVPTTNALGLHVRQVLPGRQSTTILVDIGTAGGSTTLISSAAGAVHRVFAFSVMSSVTAFSSCAFLSSNNARWGLLIGSGSSGITGANLAVAPPGSLFETEASAALGFSASSTGLYRVSIGYFTE